MVSLHSIFQRFEGDNGANVGTGDALFGSSGRGSSSGLRLKYREEFWSPLLKEGCGGFWEGSSLSLVCCHVY